MLVSTLAYVSSDEVDRKLVEDLVGSCDMADESVSVPLDSLPLLLGVDVLRPGRVSVGFARGGYLTGGSRRGGLFSLEECEVCDVKNDLSLFPRGTWGTLELPLNISGAIGTIPFNPDMGEYMGFGTL